ncbi:OmpA family protein [Sulfurospirillum arcachonense]|uniref:OmpA family protein n=1 Tax=Sulfurospirillum arcachonense TaxID=57666 RepID=UPI001FE00744|nr:OmpA family protein [Sulfurospirillum arcachonense]
MAGLLFVFILLLGAIVVKYVFIQTDLQAIRTDLQKEKDALGLSEDALSDKKKRLEKIRSQLKNTQQENFHLSFELTKAKQQLLAKDKEISNAQNRQKEQDEYIATKIEEIALKKNEIQKLKDLLFDYELKEKDLKEKNENFAKEIEKNIHAITLKDEELAQLENTLLIQSKEHQALIEELDITKVKIKSLTGLRIKVVSKLKDKLGKNIDIDKDSGAIRFSSNILFEQDSFRLKEGAKQELSNVLKEYINTLLLDPDIKQYIDQINIEGFTNSDGTYLYNLKLSQQRALEVMKFLYEKYPQDEALFRKYVSATGRSNANTIIDSNGNEDKDASRRIEIKFRIKNEKAISELEKFLAK